jgi:hypothetical protein
MNVLLDGVNDAVHMLRLGWRCPRELLAYGVIDNIVIPVRIIREVEIRVRG